MRPPDAGAFRIAPRTSARATLLGLVAASAIARPAAAQGAAQDGGREAATIARTFELRGREGAARQLDDGYRRHLDWHARAGERWAWYLWQVTNGPRAGLYVDGTFGHAWADFDRAVDPPGDAADNALNVDPFATRGANHAWRLRSELGGAPVDPEAAPFVWRAEYRVRAGADTAFAAALGRLRAALGARPFAVFELASGGALPTYAVWVPAATWAEAGALADRAAAATRDLAGAAAEAQAELWRFRPDLSLCRSNAARCHVTLTR